MFAAQSDLAWKQGDIFLGRTADGKDAGFAAERGAICVAGSRAGKGSALIIPNLLRWPHAALVIDPKGENASATWEKRETFGPVYVLDPFGVADVPERLRAACNPLENISADSATAREDIRVIADGLVMRSNEKDAVWDDGAVTVIAGLIAHAITTAEIPSLPAMRSLLKCPPDELVDVFAAMAVDGEAFGGLARTAAAIGLDDTRSAGEFVAGAARHTDWLDSPAMAALLERSPSRSPNSRRPTPPFISVCRLLI
jgi:type IV secretion system protein VirD4